MDNRVTHSQAKIPLIDTATSLIFATLATKHKILSLECDAQKCEQGDDDFK